MKSLRVALHSLIQRYFSNAEDLTGMDWKPYTNKFFYSERDHVVSPIDVFGDCKSANLWLDHRDEFFVNLISNRGQLSMHQTGAS